MINVQLPNTQQQVYLFFFYLTFPHTDIHLSNIILYSLNICKHIIQSILLINYYCVKDKLFEREREREKERERESAQKKGGGAYHKLLNVN